MLILLLLMVIGGSVSAALGYWYLPKADVTVYVKPQTISRQVSFTIDPNMNQLDMANATIPGVLLETEVTASSETQATGEKLVGERAKGTVTLYNRTDSVKTFAAGTQLTSNGLSYTINEDVSMASASSKENPDLSITTEPATVSVSVTAVTIGAEYNLGKDSEFTVANFDKSSYIARSAEELQGGTSRQITAVSQADIDQVRSSVLKEIEAKVVAQVEQTQQGFTGAIILSDDDQETEEDFSATVGDEANTVRLESSLMVRSMTYKKSDVSTLVQNLILDEIPVNFQLNPDDVSLQVQSTKELDSGMIEVTSQASVLVSPNINTQAIIADIRGKFPQVTESYFQNLPGFERVAIDIRPKLPEKLHTFPRIEENIQIHVELVE